jgi:hypothetical protein
VTADVPTVPVAACPLCHTPSARLCDEEFAAGGDWQCSTCGQNWTAQRLATVAAYEAWVISRSGVTSTTSDQRPRE